MAEFSPPFDRQKHVTRTDKFMYSEDDAIGIRIIDSIPDDPKDVAAWQKETLDDLKDALLELDMDLENDPEMMALAEGVFDLALEDDEMTDDKVRVAFPEHPDEAVKIYKLLIDPEWGPKAKALKMPIPKPANDNSEPPQNMKGSLPIPAEEEEEQWRKAA